MRGWRFEFVTKQLQSGIIVGAQGQFRPQLGQVVRECDAFASTHSPCEQAARRLVERKGLVRCSDKRFIGCRTERCAVRPINN